ncbi:DUF1201 domain-containing protein [Mycoplasmopsis gallinacea]|uniref:DUF1201 domain-containing protein n=1 Tax=Mycoplasmopsis gallinacea TaxID=29556 RepID=A0A6H0V1Z5_9BACT|nr:DUF1201 domain-containing protein [Mycoplasmopsis gallinacea]
MSTATDVPKSITRFLISMAGFLKCLFSFCSIVFLSFVSKEY